MPIVPVASHLGYYVGGSRVEILPWNHLLLIPPPSSVPSRHLTCKSQHLRSPRTGTRTQFPQAHILPTLFCLFTRSACFPVIKSWHPRGRHLAWWLRCLRPCVQPSRSCLHLPAADPSSSGTAWVLDSCHPHGRPGLGAEVHSWTPAQLQLLYKIGSGTVMGAHGFSLSPPFPSSLSFLSFFFLSVSLSTCQSLKNILITASQSQVFTVSLFLKLLSPSALQQVLRGGSLPSCRSTSISLLLYF